MTRVWLAVALACGLLACEDVFDFSSLVPDEPIEEVDVAYPVVLCHGFFGFEAFAGLDFATYYYGVKAALAEAGELEVFTPAVDPFNDSEVRGAQLLAHVEDVIEFTGAAKVNLVAHSQGGLDARYVAHLRPDLVASVTTISTPHRGTSLIDAAIGLTERPILRGVVDGLVRLIGAPLYDAVGEETSVMAAMYALSTPGVAAFNAVYTDAPGVAYYSIAGRTGHHAGGDACDAPDRPAFISRYDDGLDPVDLGLLFTEAILDGPFFGQIPNDGLITVETARWRRFLGCIPADHLDEIGHLFGDLPGLLNPFRHRPFYVELVAWLRTQGH